MKFHLVHQVAVDAIKMLTLFRLYWMGAIKHGFFAPMLYAQHPLIIPVQIHIHYICVQCSIGVEMRAVGKCAKQFQQITVS